jgi:hypothetical protein
MALRQPDRSGYTLAAVYADAAAARAAIQTLERAGIDGVHLTTEGLPEQPDTRMEDRRGIGHVFRRAIMGTITGAGVGLIAGFLGCVMYNVVTGGSLLDHIGLTLVIAAAFGSAAGLIYGGIAGVSMTPGWERTFEGTAGEVTVVIRSDDPGDVDRARAVMNSTGPIHLDTSRIG